MSIEQLRYLVAVATFSSINQAATALHMSQPNLSLALKSLEDELGYELFMRTHRGIEMTTKGLLFLDQAKEVLLQFERLRQLNSTALGPNGALSVASMPLCRVHYALVDYYRAHEKLPKNVSIEECMRDQVLHLVSNQDCEIGIIYAYNMTRKSVVSQINAQNLQCFTLAPCTIAVLMGEGNPLFASRPEHVRVDQLKKFYRVSYGILGRAAYSRTQVPNLTEVAGEIIVNDQIDFYRALASCPSFSITPRTKTPDQSEAALPLHYADLDGVSISGEYMFVKHQSRTLSDTAAEFINILRAQLQ